MKKLISTHMHLRQNMLGIICMCLSLYFAYHFLAGERSYIRYMSLQSQNKTLAQEYLETRAARETIERRVVMMRPGSIDPDLLEEQVRKTLGYARDDEKIILMN